jgi:predicted adenine nucleotide alpha hydrolase (AANH) superfamily ATPase
LFIKFSNLRWFREFKRKINRKIFKTKNQNSYSEKGRKITGGKYIKFRKKKLRENQGQKRKVKLEKKKRKIEKGYRGEYKGNDVLWKYVNIQDKGK